MADTLHPPPTDQELTPPNQNVKVTLLVIGILILTAIAGGVYYMTEMSSSSIELKNRSGGPISVQANVGAQNWNVELEDDSDEKVRFEATEEAPMNILVTFPDGRTMTAQTESFTPVRPLKGSVRIKDDEIKPSTLH